MDLNCLAPKSQEILMATQGLAAQLEQEEGLVARQLPHTFST